MSWWNWLNLNSSAVTALATIAYVIVSGFLWDATRRNAKYTAGALNLQAVTTYLEHGPSPWMREFRVGDIRHRNRVQHEIIRTLFSKLAPHQWEAIEQAETVAAERLQPGQAAPQ